MTDQQPTDRPIGGWLRLLALLLTVWEPVAFAVAAAGTFNAISVRGAPVAVGLGARLLTTALSVAAGRSLLEARPASAALTKLALMASALVQVIGILTPYFPSNRLPGEAPLYVGWTVLYYGGWLTYVARSKRVAALSR